MGRPMNLQDKAFYATDALQMRYHCKLVTLEDAQAREKELLDLLRDANHYLRFYNGPSGVIDRIDATLAQARPETTQNERGR